MTQLFKNDAVSLLAHSVSQTDVLLVLTAGTGAKFDNIESPDDFYLVTIENWNTGENEICKVIGKAGDILTVERAQEGTIARAWDINSLVDHRLTARTLKALQPVVNAEVMVDVVAAETIITTAEPFDKRSTQLYVGGLRQALNTDYVELSPITIKLLYPLSLADITEGQNIVLDFMRRY